MIWICLVKYLSGRRGLLRRWPRLGMGSLGSSSLGTFSARFGPILPALLIWLQSFAGCRSSPVPAFIVNCRNLEFLAAKALLCLFIDHTASLFMKHTWVYWTTFRPKFTWPISKTGMTQTHQVTSLQAKGVVVPMTLTGNAVTGFPVSRRFRFAAWPGFSGVTRLPAVICGAPIEPCSWTRCRPRSRSHWLPTRSRTTTSSGGGAAQTGSSSSTPKTTGIHTRGPFWRDICRYRWMGTGRLPPLWTDPPIIKYFIGLRWDTHNGLQRKKWNL